MTLRQYRKSAEKKLINSPTPALDVKVIIESILDISETELLLQENRIEPSEQDLQKLDEAIEKRKTGLPVAYITGHKEFYYYSFYVTPAVLIPKPDTEVLVEQAVRYYENWEKDAGTIDNCEYKICDMCTGSGCIGISMINGILDGIPAPKKIIKKLTLADLSPQALEVAKINADNFLKNQKHVEVNLVQSNLFEKIPGKFNMILSNPPYIPSAMVTELLKDGRSEPRLALDGDIDAGAGLTAAQSSDGLAIMRRLIPQAFEHLESGGIFLVESGEYNAEATAELMKAQGFIQVEIIRDYEGQMRVTKGLRP